ncbi:hypothetical protein DL98DRAFT_551355 [Cadophora sp. DSE1049]|nr:hypothetical protein DL98DRAFT_551355 [Cadophora sp. DSE1049]
MATRVIARRALLRRSKTVSHGAGPERSIRYNPEDLLVTQGIATAALTLPASEAQGAARIKSKQQRLLQRLQSNATPEDPKASQPFARERQRILCAVAEDEFAYRIEQVICFDVAGLLPSRRNLRTILRPIFQLMRFYLQETQHYTKLLRCFRPTVFPQILGSFARVFDLGIGSQGLGMALSEGVAALDRLGHYCFTGTPIALISSVLGPLKTMESLEKGGWPEAWMSCGGRGLLLLRTNSGAKLAPRVTSTSSSISLPSGT